MLQLPVLCFAEYRGAAPPGTFVNSEGEKIEFGPKLKFEYETHEGDVVLIPLSSSQLDTAADFDVQMLDKGQRVRLEGLVTLQDRGSPRGSFFRPTVVTLADDGDELQVAGE